MIRNSVVIRFSLRIEAWAKQAYGEEANRQAWFAYRARIFNEGLLTCLERQTEPGAVAYLLMDDSDRSQYETHIRKSGLLRPIFAGTSHPASGLVAEDILKSGAQDVAISRIDSDDLVSVFYIEAINRAIRSAIARDQGFDYVIAPHGYRTDMRRIEDFHHERSPFLTLFTPVYDGRNVYALNHWDVLAQPHILCDEARWVQIIHDSNLANTFTPTSNARSIAEFWPADIPFPDIAGAVWANGAALPNPRGRPPLLRRLAGRLKRAVRGG